MMKFPKEGELPGCFENLYFDFSALCNLLNSPRPPEYRFSGTIVGVGDNKSSVWTNSEWRSLKVSMALVTLQMFFLFFFIFFYFLSFVVCIWWNSIFSKASEYVLILGSQKTEIILPSL